MDLSMRIGSVTLKNPVIVTSGEHGRDGRTIVEVAATGVGAVTTKTIIPFPVPDPLPCYALVPNGFLNCVLAAVLPAEQWFREEIPRAKKAGVPLVANLAGPPPTRRRTSRAGRSRQARTSSSCRPTAPTWPRTSRPSSPA